MKSKTILVTVLSLAVLTGGYGLVQAHGGQSQGGSGGSWFNMGSGHMGGSGWGHMGSGGHMMGSGWDHMSGSGYGFDNTRRGDRQVTDSEAIEIAERSLGGNPYLRIGTVTEDGDRFEIEIVTRKGEQLVNRLVVEKESGRVFPIDE